MTLDLVLRPPTDEFRLTPDIPAVDPVDNLPEPAPSTIPPARPAMPTLLYIMSGLNRLAVNQETMMGTVHGLEAQQRGPAMPTLLYIMSGLNRLAVNQETMMGTVHGLEAQQRVIHKRISRLEIEVAWHGRYCSATQGENSKLKDSLAGLKDDARKAATERGRAITESRRTTDGIKELKGKVAKVRENGEKLLAQGISELECKMAKLRETTEKTLTDIAQVKDNLKDTQDNVRKLSETVDQILEGIHPVNLIHDSTKSIEDNMRSVATNQTRMIARSRAAFPEILHGVSCSLDAFENWPNAHQVAQNNSGRTEREECARCPLDM